MSGIGNQCQRPGEQAGHDFRQHEAGRQQEADQHDTLIAGTHRWRVAVACMVVARMIVPGMVMTVVMLMLRMIGIGMLMAGMVVPMGHGTLFLAANGHRPAPRNSII